jgi:CRISPR-associated protein Cas1
MARSIVRGKLLNSKQFLLRLNRKRKLETVMSAIVGLNQDLSAIAKVDSLESLRGYEGIAASRYFSAFGQLMTNAEFQFERRNRRPPTDPVNSMLSFGYTLLFNNVLSLILTEGLHPYLGNLHRNDRTEPHLAFDLMEEFRSAIVDSLVMTLVNRGDVKPDDFQAPDAEGGVYLTDAARRSFLKQFEARMEDQVSHPSVKDQVSYRYAIQLQIRRYLRCVMGAELYVPFMRAV